MKIYNEKENNWVTPSEMKDGEIAIMRKHTNTKHNEYEGVIVQRYKTALVVLGKESGKSFPFGGNSNDKTILVEILPSGTLLEI